MFLPHSSQDTQILLVEAALLRVSHLQPFFSLSLPVFVQESILLDCELTLGPMPHPPDFCCPLHGTSLSGT